MKLFMLIMMIAWFIKYCFTKNPTDLIISQVWLVGEILKGE
jgi:hypothetical protein